MSKLLRRAKVKYENAVNNYKKVSIDDAYMDDCCFNLQQGIEMVLKYMVEMTGQNYVENHDIRAQINKLDKVNFDIPERDRLRMLASTLSSWEAESRYKDNFVSLNEDVKEALELLKILIAKAESLAKPIGTKTIASFGNAGSQ